MKAANSFVVAGLIVASGAAASAEPQSAYSSIDMEQCAITETDEQSGSVLMRCEDFRGQSVELLEGDLRFYLIIDDPKRMKMLSGQTLPGFNAPGKTLEWRLDEDGKAFTVIMRYHTDEDRGDGTFYKGQVLVVSKIGDEACHVATVDARRHKDANALARLAADEHARRFRCGVDEVITIGE
jgi:methyl coenzyme M reductase gamma subunit